jgi:hypothetical protein
MSVPASVTPANAEILVRDNVELVVDPYQPGSAAPDFVS